MNKEPRWHRIVKEVLREIGESKGYDVAESEKEMLFSTKFKMYSGEERDAHTMSYKPDVVWKKNHKYRAIFEIEYLNPRINPMEKRKYSIGSLMLAYIAMIRKSVNSLVFITNSDDLCQEIAKFQELSNLEFSKDIWYLYESATNISKIKKRLEEYLLKDLKL